jgi:hypothetical protein
MSENIQSSAATISVDKIDRGVGYITIRPAQEIREGILPLQGGEENRKVTVSSCCFVDGHIFGREIEVLDSDRRSLSTRSGELLPGTQINGGLNSFENIYIGTGAVIRGGVLAGKDITISSAIAKGENTPERIIIEGSVAGENITIGDGVVILGPVIAQSSLTIGNGVTIRDYAVSPKIELGNGCLIGGIISYESFKCGTLNTIASSKLLLPDSKTSWEIGGDIRSPYPGCNNCPSKSQLGGNDSPLDYGRRLSCHLFSEISAGDNSIEVKKGSCSKWTSFPIENEEFHWKFSDSETLLGTEIPFTVISNQNKNNLNIDKDSNSIAIWELTAESEEEN